MRNKSRPRPVGIPTGLRCCDNIETFIADAQGCHVEVHDDAAGWVEPLLNAGFSVSRHLVHESEDADMEVLSRLPPGVMAVAHPTHIKSVRRWREFQRKVMIENLDAITPEFRTPAGLRNLLNELPDAGICLDMAHAYGIAGLAREFIRMYRGRIAEIQSLKGNKE